MRPGNVAFAFFFFFSLSAHNGSGAARALRLLRQLLLHSIRAADFPSPPFPPFFSPFFFPFEQLQFTCRRSSPIPMRGKFELKTDKCTFFLPFFLFPLSRIVEPREKCGIVPLRIESHGKFKMPPSPPPPFPPTIITIVSLSILSLEMLSNWLSSFVFPLFFFSFRIPSEMQGFCSHGPNGAVRLLSLPFLSFFPPFLFAALYRRKQFVGSHSEIKIAPSMPLCSPSSPLFSFLSESRRAIESIFSSAEPAADSAVLPVSPSFSSPAAGHRGCTTSFE